MKKLLKIPPPCEPRNCILFCHFFCNVCTFLLVLEAEVWTLGWPGQALHPPKFRSPEPARWNAVQFKCYANGMTDKGCSNSSTSAFILPINCENILRSKLPAIMCEQQLPRYFRSALLSLTLMQFRQVLHTQVSNPTQHSIFCEAGGSANTDIEGLSWGHDSCGPSLRKEPTKVRERIFHGGGVVDLGAAR